MFCLQLYSLLGIAGYARTAGHEAEPGRSCSEHATLFGTAGSRPNRGCWPRRQAAAEAARHNVTSSIDRGPTGTRAVSGFWERRAGARVKPEQAPQGATGSVDSEE